MSSLNIDVRKLPTPKIEALRQTFEATLRDTLFKGLPQDTSGHLLERVGTGYVEAHIDAAWNGFQWGGDHVRGLVQDALQHLQRDDSREVRRPGDAPADPARPNAEVVAASYQPTTKGEAVDWALPLFDSDGYPHRLVELGAVQVVTKYSFAFAVWNRKTLQLISHQAPEGLTIGNTPMSPQERERRFKAGAAMLATLQELHAESAGQAETPSDEERRDAPRG